MRILHSIIALVLATLAVPVAAQAYPARPVRFVIGFPATPTIAWLTL